MRAFVAHTPRNYAVIRYAATHMLSLAKSSRESLYQSASSGDC